MRRLILRGLLLLLVLAAVLWLWRILFPGPERVIRKNLSELAQVASVAQNEGPLAQAINAQKLTTYFTSDIRIAVDVPGHSRYVLEGQDELLRSAVSARQMLPGLQIEIPDINVSLVPGKRAAVVNLTVRGRTPAEKDFLVQELQVDFKKIGRRWLINRAETIKTLR